MLELAPLSSISASVSPLWDVCETLGAGQDGVLEESASKLEHGLSRLTYDFAHFGRYLTMFATSRIEPPGQ
eukprot:2264936-Pleurochrysis_carterae.AAC.2